MKRMLFIALLTLASLTAAQSQTSKLTAQQRAAKAEMQKAQDAVDEDKLAEAESHAKKALELDPSSKAALLFIAQVSHRQYNRMQEGVEKTAKAREVIETYQRISSDDPDNDEAYYVVRELYGDIQEDELQRSWVMQRAINSSLSAEKRADAYLTLAQWEGACASDILSRLRDKMLSEESGQFELERLDTNDRDEIAGGQQCVQLGLQLAEQALSLTPESDLAWSCKSNLLANAAYLYELLGDEAQDEQQSNLAGQARARASELEAKRKEAELERAVKIDCGELCGKVIDAPKPAYPVIARTARVSGAVIVQLTIDEEGYVIAANAVSGPPLLRAAAVQAARAATFSTAYQAGSPVKLNGTLTYNFKLPD